MEDIPGSYGGNSGFFCQLFKIKKISGAPAAITGILTVAAACLIVLISYPFAIPSRSIEFNKISPAPKSFNFFHPFIKIQAGIFTAI